jgi:hypothetical protein
MHVIHGCLVARPFLLQGVFDFGLSPLIALELAFRDFALISIKHTSLHHDRATSKAVNLPALSFKRSSEVISVGPD